MKNDTTCSVSNQVQFLDSHQTWKETQSQYEINNLTVYDRSYNSMLNNMEHVNSTSVLLSQIHAATQGYISYNISLNNILVYNFLTENTYIVLFRARLEERMAGIPHIFKKNPPQMKCPRGNFYYRRY